MLVRAYFVHYSAAQQAVHPKLFNDFISLIDCVFDIQLVRLIDNIAPQPKTKSKP